MSDTNDIAVATAAIIVAIAGSHQDFRRRLRRFWRPQPYSRQKKVQFQKKQQFTLDHHAVCFLFCILNQYSPTTVCDTFQ